MKLSKIVYAGDHEKVLETLKTWLAKHGDHMEKVLKPVIDVATNDLHYELCAADSTDYENTLLPVLEIYPDAGEASDDTLSDRIGYIDRESKVHRLDETNFTEAYVPDWCASSNASIMVGYIIDRL